jgi:predicted nucleic acid-binding protein
MLKLVAMMILIDTSAIIALLCAEDRFHHQARQTWFDLLDQDQIIQCNNYILLEAISLIQKRYGMDILRTFHNDILPVLEVDWLDRTKHNQAMNALFLTNRRGISLVDYASFETMRDLDIRTAFTFDKHFAEQGFNTVPDLS